MDILAALVDRSKENILHSRTLVATAEALTRQSRRARRPRFCGASDAGDPVTSTGPTVRAERTADRVRQGTLPTAGSILNWRWVGIGTGRSCDGCADPIARSERELEAQLGGTIVFHFHVGCFAAWSNVRTDGA